MIKMDTEKLKILFDKNKEIKYSKKIYLSKKDLIYEVIDIISKISDSSIQNSFESFLYPMNWIFLYELSDGEKATAEEIATTLITYIFKIKN
jgi:hypothetical protein